MAPRRALVIAPLYNGKPFSPLTGGTAVADQLRRLLSTNGKYEVEVLNTYVKRSDFRTKAQQFFDTDGELVFYFYGHGGIGTGGLGVFLTSDATSEDEGVLMGQIAALSRQSRAREVVTIIDCCHAASANYAQISDHALRALKSEMVGPGRVFLAGCATHQHGWESRKGDEASIGIFSYYVLRGLSGEARIHNGVVRGSSLGTYVTEVFKSWRQNPVFQADETGEHLGSSHLIRDGKAESIE